MFFACFRRCLVPLLTASLISACAALPEPGENGSTSDSLHGLLVYAQQVQRMSPQAIARERNSLATPQTPAAQIRLAMLLGQTHAAGDLNRAIGLLNALSKSNASGANELRPLAQMLAAQYQERAKADVQNDKLAQQLKEAQRQNEDLQEKINAIADIENSLQARPRNDRRTSRRSR